MDGLTVARRAPHVSLRLGLLALFAALLCAFAPAAAQAVSLEEIGDGGFESYAEQADAADAAGLGTLSASVEASGTSGTVAWTLDSEGVLTLAPEDGSSGSLASITEEAEIPWYDYCDSITKAVIEPGVALGSSTAFLFCYCTEMTSIEGLGNLDTSAATDLSFMFFGCIGLTSLDLSSWDTSNVLMMMETFGGCTALKTLKISGWDTSSLLVTYGMFDTCTALTSLDLSSWDTSKVVYMDGTFYGCSALKTLDISGWSTASCESSDSMFTGCTALTTVTLGKKFSFVTSTGYLPTPTYGTGEGVWKNTSTGKTYAAESVPNKTAATYKRTFLVSSATVTLSTTEYTYNSSKTRKPSVTVEFGGKTLTKGTHYTVTYASGRKAIGKYKVTVKGTGSFSGSTSVYFTIKPTKVTVKSANSATSKKLTVSWSKAAGGVSYQIAYRKKGSSTWKYATASSSSTSKTVSGLSNGTTYYVKVRAYKTVDSKKYYGSWSAAERVKVQSYSASKPAKVTGLSVTGGATTVKLTWTSASRASKYVVYRATSKSGSYKKIGTTTHTSYSDTSVTAGKTYYYKVRAYRSSNKSYGTSSAVVSCKAVCPKPSTFKLSSSDNAVTVKWSTVSGASGYKIYRATSKSGTYKLVKTISSASTTSWKNTGLTANKTYYYKVRAYTTVGSSKVSGTATSAKSVTINGYVSASKAYTLLNEFRTTSGVWYWNSDDSTKTYFNKSGYTTLSKLSKDADLEDAAEVRAKELASSFSHYRPDGTLCYTAYPSSLMASGENIAMGYSTAASVMTAWEEESESYDGQGHRRNMLSDSFTVVGIACYVYEGTYYWAMVLGAY